MTADDLRQLIEGRESLDLEFKGEERAALSDAELVEAVVCLANRGGTENGYLLIGVEDDGRVTGARSRHGATTEAARVEALIGNSTRPAVACRAEILELDEGSVLVIAVPPSRTPVATAKGKYVRRALKADGAPECVPFFFHEMQGRQADLSRQDPTAHSVSGASWQDLDPLELARLRRMVRESTGRGDAALLTLSDFEITKALGAVEGDREPTAVRLLGLLLFGTEEALRRLVPTHEVALQDLAGTHVGANDFLRWPLLRVMDEALARYRARAREREVFVGMQRIGVPDYPERAFREAIANALVHRDYRRPGAAHIQWREDQLEISNPGGFPEGVRLDNLLVTPPHPRNPALADAFKRAGIVERSGRGIDTIFEEQLRSGRPAPSYDRSTESAVVLLLPGGEANLAFVKLVVEESATLTPLRAEGLLILNELWLERRLDEVAAAKLVQRPEREARAILERLVEGGLVEASGDRKRSYHLSRRVYRRLGDEDGYLRQRGPDPLGREERVIELVRRRGEVARADVMRHCGVEGWEATALLKGLVAKGVLVASGEKRWTVYRLGGMS